MTKRKSRNNDLPNTHKTRDRVTRTPLINEIDMLLYNLNNAWLMSSTQYRFQKHNPAYNNIIKSNGI